MLYGLTKSQILPNAKDSRNNGKAVRDKIPFSAHAVFNPVNRDPVAIIDEQNKNRLPDLLALRKERMSVSPFTYYRGTAIIMANDLAGQTVTGSQLVICGDAHIGNFGLYASPERHLIFELNDFDEAAPGPWEWDLKRLVTSIILAGEDLGFNKNQIHDAALQASTYYRLGLRAIMNITSLERYFVSGDEKLFLDSFSKSSRMSFEKITEKAKKRTSDQVIKKTTQADQFGRRIFIENPPVLTHLEPELVLQVEKNYNHYLKSVRPDVKLLLSQHILTDVARRVVGVGSVGTQCFLLVLTCEDESHLVLQIKQANESVISQFNRPNFTTPDTLSTKHGHGYRVVSHQQILQSASDPFLGHFQTENGLDFYVRQFRDMKGSVELETLNYDAFKQYVTDCSVVLARAHAQSRNANWVTGYLGSSDEFDHAIVKWCDAYAKQIYKDFEIYKKS